MKIFLVVTASIELGAGLLLMCVPSLAVVLLAGTPLETPAALTVTRMGGAGLVALGVACWLAREETQSRAAKGLVTAMLLYNVSAVAILTFAGIGSGIGRTLLRPGLVLHSVMTAWCIICLRQTDHIRH